MKNLKTTSAIGMFVMAAATVSLVAPLTTAMAQAASSKLASNQPGYHRIMVGNVEVIALSDGTVPLDTALLNTSDPADLNRLMKKSYLSSPVDTSVNSYIFKIGARVVLVDAGTAELFGPSLNKMPTVLKNLGITRESITDILITHIHTDHTGGLMQGSTRAFPNARVHINRKDVDYWLSPAAKAAAAEGQKVFFDQAVQKVQPYVASGQVTPFDGSVELLPGVTTVPAPGHTPGHTFYVLQSAGQKLVFWGDIVHLAAVQFPNPSVTIQFDVDTVAARASREQNFADAVQKGYMVAPAHVPFPGFGYVSLGAPTTGAFIGKDRLYQEVGAYRFYPLPFVNDAPSPAVN